jgi:hypothetical protein
MGNGCLGVSACFHKLEEGLILIVFRNTSRTTPAMPASQWFANHAMNTEVLFIKLPLIKELTDDFPLLVPATELRHVAWVFNH